MPLRNPFARRSGGLHVSDENTRPDDAETEDVFSPPGFERVDTVGSKASSLSIRSGKSQDTGEYKLSGTSRRDPAGRLVFNGAANSLGATVVNDSGVYLPPSPTEESLEKPWPRRYLPSRTSSDTRSSIGDIEHFSISRESFDSYRRSFDITARSPIIGHDSPARQSLDSARFPRIPRSAIGDRNIAREPPTEEEGFEDVGLDDQRPQPRRRGFFSKFSESQDKEPGPASQGMTRFLIPGRKRGQSQSGIGSELGNMDRPTTASSMEAQEVH